MAQSLFVLLCCTFLLCAGRIEGQSGEKDNGEGRFSGSEDRGSGTNGSGSGSGDMPEENVQVVTESTAAECVDYLSRNDNEGYNLTSSTAYTAAMCRLFCMDNTTSNQDTQLENVTIGGGGWMFKSFPQFSTENEKIHCQPYQKFAECVRGCLVRVEPSDATLNRNRCRAQCRQQCKSEKDIDDHYFNPYCKVDCNATICGQGCENYNRIVTSNTAGSPPSPIQGPRLVSSTLLADVTLSVSKSVPPTSDQEHPLEPVGIVYRVVDKNTNVTRYFQTVSPDDPLDLNDFACRTISVSFVVVNRFGVSRESPPLTLKVPGGNIMLKKPTDIELVEQKVDKRPGFFGHAVVTISWDHPQDYMEELYYVLKVTPIGACPGDNRQFSKSPITTKSVTVYDNQTGPDSVFLLDTHLIFEVCTRIWGEDNEECEEKRESLLSVTHLETTVTITDCVRHWNGSHFNYTIHWTVPEFVAYGDGIFSGFLVVAEKKITKRYIREYDVAKIPNQREYSYKWLDLYPMEEEYQFTVSIQWMRPDNYRSPYVYDAKCTKSALPPPPSVGVTLFYKRIGEEAVRIAQISCESGLESTASNTISDKLLTLEHRLDSVPDMVRVQSVAESLLERLRTLERKIDQIVDAVSSQQSGSGG